LRAEDRPKFTRWAFRFSTANTLWGIASGMYGLSRLMDYLRGEIERQRKEPGSGLLSALIEAEEAGDRLTQDELLAMAFLLLAAGHETTLHQIGCSVLTLLDHPEALGAWKAEPDIAESAVNELFRHVSFAQVAKPRYAREDTEFYGQRIGRGEAIFACLASANADPSHFPQPERLDLRRDARRHLAFGSSIHFCLGAALARMETEIALRNVFERFPNLRLAMPREAIRYSLRPGTRGLVGLPVRLVG
jgi:cytochrome P450 PksS